jgi:hypothetical protein
MKKQELYKISCNGELLHENLSRDEMFDILDDLSEKFYEEGAPNPADIVVEYEGDSQE